MLRLTSGVALLVRSTMRNSCGTRQPKFIAGPTSIWIQREARKWRCLCVDIDVAVRENIAFFRLSKAHRDPKWSDMVAAAAAANQDLPRLTHDNEGSVRIKPCF